MKVCFLPLNFLVVALPAEFLMAPLPWQRPLGEVLRDPGVGEAC